MRWWILGACGAGVAASLGAVWVSSAWIPVAAVSFAVALWAAADALQRGDNVRRVYPVLGSLIRAVERGRHIPQEALLQPSWEGRPFSWLQRRIVEKRASGELENEPFGTELDYGSSRHAWFRHSIYPLDVTPELSRVSIGGPACTQPYSASLLNVSAMSFGSISGPAIRALGAGAKRGGFALNTGEGGLTDHHLESGADLIWQLGTGYFGARTEDGAFDPEAYRQRACDPRVKMIEIKISQGAKPGFGAILPASKNTVEVARYRLVEPHSEIRSPAHHSAFRTDDQLIDFVARLRALSGGKPVGLKLCVGDPAELDRLCNAMVERDDGPDYLAVAGGEGGSGAADLESVHHVGAPAEVGLVAVVEALERAGLRARIKVIVAGKIISGFDIVRYLSLGADACYAARAMMFALGCTQALKCNTNRCPTGITTMDPQRTAGIVVPEKSERVARYHERTLAGVAALLRSAGLTSVAGLTRDHVDHNAPIPDR